jgi:DUF971 family protein
MIGATVVIKTRYGISECIWLLAESLHVYSAARENQGQTSEQSAIDDKKRIVAKIELSQL